MAGLPDILAQFAPAYRYTVITDTNVEALYAREVAAALRERTECTLFSFSPGERSKTRETWASLTDGMLEAGVGRDSAVVAIGGGVTGDIAGFVAATYLRGIPCVQVPTSLLSMIDSSVGGKTGVDTPHGKNLVGAFHQPAIVVVDASTLETLPRQHISAGAAEALKHGAIADPAFFNWIVANKEAVLRRDPDTLLELVRRSVQIKAEIVAEDETEQGKRAVLNFGHTVGHALEALLDFEMLHGEAVAIGMVAEAELGTVAGITAEQVAARLKNAARDFNLPVKAPGNLTAESLLEAMEHDKKGRLGNIRFTLLDRIGSVHVGSGREWTHTVPRDATIKALSAVI